MVTRITIAGARTIPIYFREWRNEKGWSQQDVAERLGTTKQTVSRIERGVMDWGKLYLEAFSHICECPNPIDPISRLPKQANFHSYSTNYDAMIAELPEAQQQQVAVFITFMQELAKKKKV